jgi:DNA-binding NtrC family response regulator
MAATNRDIDAALRDGTFREDLYFRLGVVTLVVPPLRARREDIAPLVHSYLERFSQQLGRPGLALREDALAAMQVYAWPGNVRELINVVERAVLLARGPEISIEDLPPSLLSPSARAGARAAASEIALRANLARLPFKEARRAAIRSMELAYLNDLLERTAGRVGEAARQAGLDPRSLYAKMREHGLRKEDFRTREARRAPGTGS